MNASKDKTTDIRTFSLQKFRIYRILDSFLLIWRAHIIKYDVQRRINKIHKRDPVK